MGYSISVSVRSPALQDQMIDFLVDNYKPWPEVLGENSPSSFDGPTDDLISNPHAKCQIGFNTAAVGGIEKEYCYAVLRWTALQVGRKRRTFRVGSFSVPVPYYVEDRIVRPILCDEVCRKVTKGMTPFVTDRYGLLVSTETARQLSWLNIPTGTFERVSATSHDKSLEEIRESLIESGIERARVVLQFMRAEIARLDVLWRSVV